VAQCDDGYVALAGDLEEPPGDLPDLLRPTVPRVLRCDELEVVHHHQLHPEPTDRPAGDDGNLGRAPGSGWPRIAERKRRM
jgi:hypothetical protein